MFPTMMRSILIFFALAAMATAFAPIPSHIHSLSTKQNRVVPSALNMGFGMDPDKKRLTRENEPEDFFSTNTDKMTDQEKIPIAIAGLVFISLPFIAGLIALYSAK